MRTKTFTILIMLMLMVAFASYFIGIQNNGNRENRTMANFDMVFNPEKDSVAYKDTISERFEAALRDQFKLRIQAVDLWIVANYLTSVLAKDIYFYENKSNAYTYTEIGDYIRIDGTNYISNKPILEEQNDSSIRIHIDQINRLHKMFPDMHFYAYYVTQANETGWFDDYLGVEVPDCFGKVESLLPEYVRTDRLKYKDLEDYKSNHYASDHHWNHMGAQRGYEDIYKMISGDMELSPVKKPKREINYSELYDFVYRGSYSNNLGNVYKGYDEFLGYEYDLPQRKIFAITPENMNVIPLRELGLQREYIRGEFNPDSDHYIAYYGTGISENGDRMFNDHNAIYMIQNENSDTNHNLLIYGDSYNRAIRDMLASHFDTTLYFQRDIFIYDNVFIDDLINKYNIDTILFSGVHSIWTIDEYVFDFLEDE